MFSIANLAHYLLNKCVLMVNNQICRIAEIEIYLYSNGHEDIYTDRHRTQATTGNFYFARAGKALNSCYKSGTYKRMDFCFGYEGFYCGVLLRSLQKEDGNIIEGPCRCVDYILKSYDFTVIDELVDKSQDLSFLDNKYNLVLREAPLAQKEIFSGPRIGLNSQKAPFYRNLPYRFAIAGVKKEKSSLKLCENIIIP